MLSRLSLRWHPTIIYTSLLAIFLVVLGLAVYIYPLHAGPALWYNRLDTQAR